MTQSLMFPEDSGADFSEDRLYRYKLWRRFGAGGVVNFIMLNPSTADEITNDPTVTRCQKRAAALGYGMLVVTNIFAYRSVNPKLLQGVRDPVGPLNDAVISTVAGYADLIVCGWGNHGTLRNRGNQVLDLLRKIGAQPHCLKLTGEKQPQHPLYLGYDVQPIQLEEAA